MSLFDLFRKKPQPEFDPRLFGKWLLQQSQQDLPNADETVAEFSPEGALTYSITQDGKRSIMKMTYRVEGGVIVSDQPSSPREERTEYRFEGDSLVLVFGGQVSCFGRL